MYQGWQQTLITSQVAGPTINATGTTLSTLPPAAIYTFPANFFQIGSTIRVSARGSITTNTTSGTGTLSIVPQLGGANLGFTTNTITLTAGITTGSFEFEYISTCRAIGNSTVGSFITIGSFSGGTLVANQALMLPPTAPVAISTFNTAGTLALDLQALFSTATATTALVIQEYVVESLN